MKIYFEGLLYTYNIVFIVEPPSDPVISGLPENEALREGQMVFLTCSSTDGSPKPKLTWFKVRGDGSEETEIKDIDDNVSNAQNLNIKPHIFDSAAMSQINKSEISSPKVQSLATIKISASREDNSRLYR